MGYGLEDVAMFAIVGGLNSISKRGLGVKNEFAEGLYLDVVPEDVREVVCDIERIYGVDLVDCVAEGYGDVREAGVIVKLYSDNEVAKSFLRAGGGDDDLWMIPPEVVKEIKDLKRDCGRFDKIIGEYLKRAD
jgi:hypothetical protein